MSGLLPVARSSTQRIERSSSMTQTRSRVARVHRFRRSNRNGRNREKHVLTRFGYRNSIEPLVLVDNGLSDGQAQTGTRPRGR